MSSSSELTLLKGDLEALDLSESRIQTAFSQYQQRLVELQELQETLRKEESQSSKQLKEVRLALREMQMDPEVRAGITARTDKISASLASLRDALPHTGSRFLEWFVGEVNVVLPSQAEKFRYKKQYEDFKSTFSVMLIPLCLLAWWSEVLIMETLFNFALLYFFITLLLREKILKNNGSTIAPWWFFHHYLSAILSFCLLTFPHGEQFFKHHTQLNVYFLYFSLLTMGQTQYQKSRIYTMRALGIGNKMDVSDSHSAASLKWTSSTTLAVLMPLLLLGQLFQAWNGYCLITYAVSLGKAAVWQLWAVGGLFLILATGNFVTTLKATVFKKKREVNVVQKKKD
jgi:hypothetical protein